MAASLWHCWAPLWGPSMAEAKVALSCSDTLLPFWCLSWLCLHHMPTVEQGWWGRRESRVWNAMVSCVISIHFRPRSFFLHRLKMAAEGLVAPAPKTYVSPTLLCVKRAGEGRCCVFYFNADFDLFSFPYFLLHMYELTTSNSRCLLDHLCVLHIVPPQKGLVSEREMLPFQSIVGGCVE